MTGAWRLPERFCSTTPGRGSWPTPGASPSRWGRRLEWSGSRTPWAGPMGSNTTSPWPGRTAPISCMSTTPSGGRGTSRTPPSPHTLPAAPEISICWTRAGTFGSPGTSRIRRKRQQWRMPLTGWRSLPTGARTVQTRRASPSSCCGWRWTRARKCSSSSCSIRRANGSR